MAGASCIATGAASPGVRVVGVIVRSSTLAEGNRQQLWPSCSASRGRRFGAVVAALLAFAGQFLAKHLEAGDQAVALCGGEPVERALEGRSSFVQPRIHRPFLALGDRDNRPPPVGGILPTLDQ